MSLRGKTAVVGLGITQMGKVFGYDSNAFAAEAVKLATEDAGLDKEEIDGLITHTGMSSIYEPLGGLRLSFQNYLGLQSLKLLSYMDVHGATPSQMIQYAAMAIDAGMCNVVVCVCADVPLRGTKSSAGGAYSLAGRETPGILGLGPAHGLPIVAPNIWYAFAAQRHMFEYGTTSRQLGAIAVAQRSWAVMNPIAQMRTPITIEDHQNSRIVAEPLRLLDCCLASNGGIAVIVTSAERARSLKQPPVYILGMGQGHPGDTRRAGSDWMTRTGALTSKETAFRMAGITVRDIDVSQLYDCYTYTVLVTLEDYGFCKKGEGGPFVEDGKLGPGGSCPTNTGGGVLSAYYMQGMTPISEGVIQARGQGGERQVRKHDIVLVSCTGGQLSHHCTLILSPHTS
ncbi:thiolase family protein [Chloroflexota bacterium]